MNKYVFGLIGALGLALLPADKTPMWFSILLIVAGGILALSYAYLSKDTYRADLQRFLDDPNPKNPYRAMMIPMLKRVRRWRQPVVVNERTGRLDFHSIDMRSAVHTAYTPFGWTLLDFAMLWAVAYPLILSLIHI